MQKQHVNGELALRRLVLATRRAKETTVRSAVECVKGELKGGQFKFSTPCNNYHFGGSFRHAATLARGRHLDLHGRVFRWRKEPLVDGSVFSVVPTTTFTLAVMANGHRIATAREALR